MCKYVDAWMCMLLLHLSFIVSLRVQFELFVQEFHFDFELVAHMKVSLIWLPEFKMENVHISHIENNRRMQLFHDNSSMAICYGILHIGFLFILLHVATSFRWWIQCKRFQAF